MNPKSGNRYSEKIMRKQNVSAGLSAPARRRNAARAHAFILDENLLFRSARQWAQFSMAVI